MISMIKTCAIISPLLIAQLARAYNSSYCFPDDGEELHDAVDNYFYGGGNDGSIGTWCVKDVTNFKDLFRGMNLDEFSDVDLGGWNMSSATSIKGMFQTAKQYQGVGIDQWDVSKVTNMNNLFRDCDNFDQNIGDWNVVKLKNANHMFRNAPIYTGQGLEKWKDRVGLLRNARWMFAFTDSFVGTSIVDWDVKSLKRLDSMFRDAVTFNADLSSWNLAKATVTSSMFRNAKALDQNLCSWSDNLFLNGVLMTVMFSGATLCEPQDTPIAENGIITPLCKDCSSSQETPAPTPSPTSTSTALPTSPPSPEPTAQPTPLPTNLPTTQPTSHPTDSPSAPPTSEPTANPTPLPTVANTVSPTASPTSEPTSEPTAAPVLVTPAPSTASPVTPSPVDNTEQEPSILPNWDFEEDTINPWKPSGEATISLATADAFSGQYALVTDRREGVSWDGIAVEVVDWIFPGVVYEVSFYAKLVNVLPEDSSNGWMTMRESTPSGNNYIGVAYAGSGGLTSSWTKVTGSYMLPEDKEVTALRLYVEGVANAWDFAVDEIIFQDSRPQQVEYYVGSADNTEHVTIPQPPLPDPATTGTNCPDQAAGLILWKDLYPSLNEGADVTLDENASILIDETISTTLGFITIPATSELIFAENVDGISIAAMGFEVQGNLIAGSETCRYQTELSITLHGDRPSGITDIANAMPTYYKGISVVGRLELHGKRFYRTWTRLSRRAYPGENFLYLQDEVNWEPGQAIVLLTTAMRDSRDWHENEIFTIINIDTENLPRSQVKAVVYLDRAIDSDHIANPNYQAEVGLLSRNIIVQGSDTDSLPTDASEDTCQTSRTNGGSTGVFGYDQVTCPDKHLTGYGGHIMVHSGGVGYVEGVELFRMGQTNVLGRYPMHFHVLGDLCPGCYLKDSSIHESYYRCISIHGTNGVTVSENVAYDVTGFCYYLEDGVEEDNTLSYNLAAHIHFIGSPAIGSGQNVDVVEESLDLTLPADIAASGFYITNLHNRIIGNTAAGGWAGFAFPVLPNPVGPHKAVDYNPAERVTLEIDGNVAHSTAHFWDHAAAFYFGGSLYYNDDGKLEYNAGRDQSNLRDPCVQDANGSCENTWNQITNSKVFLVPNVGIGSWSGRMEVKSYECHDIGLALEALAAGFWIDEMMATCRTGEILSLPAQRADYINGDGFFWYDTFQEHIITNSKFRNCGYRSDNYDQYDSSPTRGCDGNPYNGCDSSSTVFGFLTHSDEHNPEIMQATKNIQYDDVGRRFKLTRTDFESVSGRLQNWHDVDGSASGLFEPTFMGSGFASAGHWWLIDDDVVQDVQAPLHFIKKNGGQGRGMAHIKLNWDDSLHDTVGDTSCTNGPRYDSNGNLIRCDAVGRIRHLGPMYDLTNDPVGGLPVTAGADIAGLAGGYGWLLELDGGSPHTLQISHVELTEDTAVFLSVPYPLGTSFSISANAASWCYESCSNWCKEIFTSVSSVEEVRQSEGNVYHFDATTGLLTIMVTMTPQTYTGTPSWKHYNFHDRDDDGEDYALDRFEREGVLLPKAASHSMIEIIADCSQNGPYCAETPLLFGFDDNVCPPGLEQFSYDRCCEPDGSNCEYAYIPDDSEDPGENPTSSSNNILDNGDFEQSFYGVCPWDSYGSGQVEANVEITDVYPSGSSTAAVLVSNRANFWDGIGQDITTNFEYNTTYQFNAHIKILNGNVANSIQVMLRVKYDKETDPNEYRLIDSRSDLQSNTWETINAEYTLNTDDLQQDYDVVQLTLYFQTSWDSEVLHDFIVDDVSMVNSDDIIITL